MKSTRGPISATRILRALLLALVVALLGTGAVACGGDDEGDSGSGTESSSSDSGSASTGGFENGTLTIVADPDGALAYTTDTLEAEAGKVEVVLENQSSMGHDVVIETEDGEEIGRTDVITGDTASFEADLEPGTYTYYCSVPGHREAGMEGTLTVE
ncbi:hypothetical protein HJD18_10920 [Thermoleophilia bacterium SCSIO 60948]|nr:hypothetical protein HJD18_10920 [Thermoleophilia bacterium SCSIO 60948]